MGREIEQIALERGHTIAIKIGSGNRSSLTDDQLREADVAIEFSTPETVLQNISSCLDAGLPVVVGTTGWHNRLEDVREETAKKKGSLFFASNFSLGVNLFFKLNVYLAELMNNYEAYDVSMEEIHHIHKLDKPSGTAISLATQVIEKLDRKKSWSLDQKDARSLYIKDIREGEVPGTHTLRYSSAVDDIEITHRAHNRKGFALGAVIAAEFLKDKKGIYSMSDLI